MAQRTIEAEPPCRLPQRCERARSSACSADSRIAAGRKTGLAPDPPGARPERSAGQQCDRLIARVGRADQPAVVFRHGFSASMRRTIRVPSPIVVAIADEGRLVDIKGAGMQTLDRRSMGENVHSSEPPRPPISGVSVLTGRQDDHDFDWRPTGVLARAASSSSWRRRMSRCMARNAGVASAAFPSPPYPRTLNNREFADGASGDDPLAPNLCRGGDRTRRRSAHRHQLEGGDFAERLKKPTSGEVRVQVLNAPSGASSTNQAKWTQAGGSCMLRSHR